MNAENQAPDDPADTTKVLLDVGPLQLELDLTVWSVAVVLMFNPAEFALGIGPFCLRLS